VRWLLLHSLRVSWGRVGSSNLLKYVRTQSNSSLMCVMCFCIFSPIKTQSADLLKNVIQKKAGLLPFTVCLSSNEFTDNGV